MSKSEAAGMVADGSSAADLNAEILCDEGDIAALYPEWRSLVARIPDAPWSTLPSVHETWRQVLRAYRSPVVVVRDSRGTLRAVMPLMRDLAWRGPACMPRFDYDPRDRSRVIRRGPAPIPVRQLSVMGSLPATLLWVGILATAPDRRAATTVAVGALNRLRGWDVAILPVRDGAETEEFMAAFGAGGAATYARELGRRVQNVERLRPFDSIIATAPKKFRGNVRRARRFAEAAGLRFGTVEGAQAVGARLAEVAEVARASWKQTGRAEQDVHLPYDGEQQAFCEHLLAREKDDCVPVLSVAEDPDGAVAVLLCLRHGAVCTALLTFWNGRHARASPGLLLLAHIIDRLHAQSVESLHLNATAPWVRYLVDDRLGINNVVAFRPTVLGHLLHRVAVATGRMTPAGSTPPDRSGAA